MLIQRHGIGAALEFVGTFFHRSFAAIQEWRKETAVNIFSAYLTLREVYSSNLRYVQYGDLLLTWSG